MKLDKDALFRHLREAREGSDEELQRRLGFTSPNYVTAKGGKPLDGDVMVALGKLFTDLEGPVSVYKVGGLLAGMVTCKQSRAPQDARVIAGRLIQGNSDLRDACAQLQVPAYMDSVGGPFFKAVFDEYGDDSVARVVTFGAAFQGVSMLEAMSLLHHRVLFGIEKSTRYRDYSKLGPDGRFQYVVDPMITSGSDEERIFRESTAGLFRIYADVMQKGSDNFARVQEFLRTKKLPFEGYAETVQTWLRGHGFEEASRDELESAYERTIAAAHKDQVRHLLPLSARTDLSLEFNAEAMRHLLWGHQARLFGEGIVIQELLRRQIAGIAGPLLAGTELFSDDQREERHANDYVNFLFETRMPLKRPEGEVGWRENVLDWSSDSVLGEGHEVVHYANGYTGTANLDLALEVLISVNGGINELCAAILAEKVSGMAEPDAMAYVRTHLKEEGNGRKLAMIRHYAGLEGKPEEHIRKNRRHRPGRAFEAVTVNETMFMPVAEVRDLRRHTLQAYRDPLNFTPEHGFFISPGLRAAGLAKAMEKANRAAAETWERLNESHGPYVASTALPMSTIVPMNTAYNLRNFFHRQELRTQPGAAPVYLKLCQMADACLRHAAPYLANMMTFVNRETEIDYGRAVQEMRSARKRAASTVDVNLA